MIGFKYYGIWIIRDTRLIGVSIRVCSLATTLVLRYGISSVFRAQLGHDFLLS